jgi:hypothetical protein
MPFSYKCNVITIWCVCHWQNVSLTFERKRVEMSSLPRQKFLSSDSCGLYYKTFRIVIYDHNDSMIVEPVL